MSDTDGRSSTAFEDGEEEGDIIEILEDDADLLTDSEDMFLTVEDPEEGADVPDDETSEDELLSEHDPEEPISEDCYNASDEDDVTSGEDTSEKVFPRAKRKRRPKGIFTYEKFGKPTVQRK